MVSSSDFAKIPGMTKEMRESLVTAFDALSDWRDEIDSVNRRHIEQVLEKTSSVARSMGWPDEATKATREFLQNASKTQTELLDRVMDGWKKQLASSTSAQSVPPIFSGAMPEFNPMAPWTFWLQAAEAWQRTWMPDIRPRDWSH